MRANLSGLVLVFLCGCGGLRPLPVAEPPSNQTEPNVSRGLRPATTTPQAIKNLQIYSDSYFSTADSLRIKEYTSSDISLGGGILGILGGVGKSVEIAVSGGLISTSAVMFSDRYQLKEQAKNYERAGDVMSCMYRAAVFLEKIGGAADSVETPKFINYRVDEVRAKLRKSQIAVDLVSPDMSKFEAAAREFQTKRSVAEDTRAKAKGLADEVQELESEKQVVTGELATAEADQTKASLNKSTSQLKTDAWVIAKSNEVVSKRSLLANVGMRLSNAKAAKTAADADSAKAETEKILAEIQKCSTEI